MVQKCLGSEHDSELLCEPHEEHPDATRVHEAYQRRLVVARLSGEGCVNSVRNPLRVETAVLLLICKQGLLNLAVGQSIPGEDICCGEKPSFPPVNLRQQRFSAIG